MGSPSVNHYDEDATLVQRWASGDRIAGQKLLLRHEPELSRFFKAQQPSDADDLTQETMLAIIEARDRFRGEASFRTYLLRIARYKLWSHRRRCQGVHIDWEEVEGALLCESREVSAPTDEKLHQAIDCLPSMLSRIIVLSFENRLTRGAIATELGIPPAKLAMIPSGIGDADAEPVPARLCLRETQEFHADGGIFG